MITKFCVTKLLVKQGFFSLLTFITLLSLSVTISITLLIEIFHSWKISVSLFCIYSAVSFSNFINSQRCACMHGISYKLYSESNRWLSLHCLSLYVICSRVMFCLFYIILETFDMVSYFLLDVAVMNLVLLLTKPLLKKILIGLPAFVLLFWLL